MNVNKRTLPGTSSERWISIDPANTSGVAVWQGKELLYTGVLRKTGNKGQHILLLGGKQLEKSPRFFVWMALIRSGIWGVVVEEGAGRFISAVKSQGKLRGYIEAVCDSQGVPYREVNVSEWRRVIKEAYGVSFPADSKKCKELSKKLVKQHFGIDASDDETDAVLVGVAAQRMRLMPWM